MDQRFEAYGETVCRFVCHATAAEKESIRAELAAHMEDHAQAFLDAGYDEDYALRIAVEAMGDPEEVGKELDREYPLRWRVLYWVFLVLLTVLVGYYLLLLPVWFPTNLIEHFQARLDPVGGHGYNDVSPSFQEVDIRRELPGGTILYIYGTSMQGGDGRYAADIYTVSYPKNPFSQHWNNHSYNTFTYTLNDDGTLVRPSSGEGGGMYFRDSLTGLPEGCTLTAHYHAYGTSFSIEIPLNWEEVSP